MIHRELAQAGLPYRFVNHPWFVEYRHPTKDLWWKPEEAHEKLKNGDLARLSELVQGEQGN